MILISIEYDELMAKGDVVSSQPSNDIEPLEDQRRVLTGDIKHTLT